jgi:hypothetical protein
MVNGWYQRDKNNSYVFKVGNTRIHVKSGKKQSLIYYDGDQEGDQWCAVYKDVAQ